MGRRVRSALVASGLGQWSIPPEVAAMAEGAWAAMTSTPGAIADGGALAYTGGDFIYALRGGASGDFYRYSISGNSWASMAATPGAVWPGGSLAYTGGDFIYALRGNNTGDFYRYSISGNSWASMTSTPGAIAGGGALAYTGRQPGLFALRGGTSQDYTLLSLVPAQDVGWTRWPPWLP